MSGQQRATAIGSISIFLWGTLALFTALTEGRLPALQLMAMTFGIAFLLMCLRWWCQGHSGIRHLRQPPRAWLTGVGAYSGYHFCYFEAMQRAPAVEVSMLAYLWPLLIVLLVTLRAGNRWQPRIVSGSLLALAGCWLLIGGDSDGFRQEYLPGYLLAGLCALIWSSYSVAGRAVKSVPTDAVGWFCAATALLATIGHLLWETTVWPATNLQWLGVLGLGLGPAGIAFFAWDHGIKHGNIALLGVFAYAAPLVSVVLLILTGFSEPGWTLLLAATAIVAGSLLAGFAKPSPGNTDPVAGCNEACAESA